MCDNGNKAGCEANCQITSGYSCVGNIGTISDCKNSCGNGILGVGEKCDNGNKPGCSINCQPDPGYSCTNKFGVASVCIEFCGDGIRTAS
jgi:cysteine-rich repeat protein